jgi:selenocysteine lyase/cysteine desulfurase
MNLRPKLNAAKINIELYEDRVRIAPSVYNTMSDVEYLINALRKNS